LDQFTELRKIYEKCTVSGYGGNGMKFGNWRKTEEMRDKRMKSREEFVEMSENEVRN
jgi:hypothetical protein